MPASAILVSREPGSLDPVRALGSELGMFDLLAEAPDAEAARGLIDRLEPDVVLVDLGSLPPGALDSLAGTAHRPVVLAAGFESAASRGRSRQGAPPRETRLDHIFVRDRDAIVPIDVDSVLRFEADGDYLHVHTGAGRYIMRAPIGELSRRVGRRFLRIHRSHLVHVHHVVRFEPHDAARLVAVMVDGSRVVASRAGSRGIRKEAR